MRLPPPFRSSACLQRLSTLLTHQPLAGFTLGCCTCLCCLLDHPGSQTIHLLLNASLSVQALYCSFLFPRLAQTVFPGIFPDLTRYQAEADQASVNQGHQPWKLSATMVAGALAASLLNWSPNSHAMRNELLTYSKQG